MSYFNTIVRYISRFLTTLEFCLKISMVMLLSTLVLNFGTNVQNRTAEYHLI